MSEKMSKLEDLVPPLKLCKLIPEGKFEDSVFQWLDMNDDKRSFVVRREYVKGNYPAPTLAEILEADRRMTITRSHTGITWAAEVWDGSRWYARNDINSATTALKLWLEVNGMEVEK